MLGVIRKRDVLSHPWVTVRCFGWRVFLKTILAGQNRTFLSVLMEADVLDARQKRPPPVVDRCVALESRAERMYRRLAERFADRPAVREFFLRIADQEREHAELLDLCKGATEPRAWANDELAPLESSLPRLEAAMGEAEDACSRLADIGEALQLVLDVESSEVNRVFRTVIRASGSQFVRALDAFHAATRKHLEYIAKAIPLIDSGLDEPCSALWRQQVEA